MKKTLATAAIVGFAALSAQANPAATAPAAPAVPAQAPAAQSAPTSAPAKSDVMPGTAVAKTGKRHKKGTEKK